MKTNHARTAHHPPVPQKRKSTRTAEIGGIPSLLSCAWKGAVLSLLALFLLAALAALAAYSAPDPDALTTPLSLGVLALAPLLGGFIAYRMGRRRGCPSPVASGLLCGGITLILLFAASLCLPDSLRGQWSPSLAWGLRGTVLAFGVLGAVMAGYAPRKKRRRKR